MLQASVSVSVGGKGILSDTEPCSEIQSGEQRVPGEYPEDSVPSGRCADAYITHRPGDEVAVSVRVWWFSRTRPLRASPPCAEEQSVAEIRAPISRQLEDGECD